MTVPARLPGDPEQAVLINYSPSAHEALLGNSGVSRLKSICELSIGWSYVLIFVFAFFGRQYYLACVLVFLIGLQCACSLFFSRQALKLDSEGITFPSAAILVLDLKLHRPWKDLKKVSFSTISYADKRLKDIFFTFHDGDCIRYRLDGFSRRDFENLIRALLRFGDHVEFSPKLDEIPLNFNPDTSNDSPELNHTEHWISEYNRRYAPTAFVPLSSGDELQNGRIRIHTEIATGGLSAIYLARSAVADPCIVKEAIVPESTEPQAASEIERLFKREAELLAKLDHPRIVKVYDYFVEDGRHYLLMPFIEGSNLRAVVISRGKCSESALLFWALEIAELIDYLHSQAPPIVHRDLTPDNFILERDGKLTLIDFGAANFFLTTVTGTVIGKAAYMPIEQFKGRPVQGSDVYSFAKTLHYCITGNDPEPFVGLSPSDYTELNVSQELTALLSDCTAENVVVRPSIKEVLIRLKPMLALSR